MLIFAVYPLVLVIAPFALVALCLVALARLLSRVAGLRIKTDGIPLRVLITGCDSGFGHILAKRLARDSLGTIVYAGCFSKKAVDDFGDEAGRQNRLRAFQLDITDEDSVTRAHEFVRSDLKADDAGLWAIVNNAGIRGKTGHPTWMTTGDFVETMNVNCIGQIRMTLTFLPLVRKSRGRVVMMGSMLGRVPAPISIPYNTAKHAVYGFADTLRIELSSMGVRVITLTPGFFPTEIIQAGPDLRKQFDALTDEEKRRYPVDYIEKKTKSISTATSFLSHSNSLEDVVDAYEDALFSYFPKDNYWIGNDAILGRTISHLPEIASTWQTALTRKLFGDPDGDIDL